MHSWSIRPHIGKGIYKKILIILNKIIENAIIADEFSCRTVDLKTYNSTLLIKLCELIRLAVSQPYNAVLF